MDSAIQVDKTHYEWASYNVKGRWVSYWHQVHEVLGTGSASVLEVGVGCGLVKNQLRAAGLDVTCVDIDERLGADRVGDVRALPFDDNVFDIVVCAQVLEHMPWEEFPRALRELHRVARRWALVTLPQSGKPLALVVTLPKLGTLAYATRTPSLRRYRFDGQHYWQVGSRGTRQRAVRARLAPLFDIKPEYTLPDFAYHRFYLLAKR
jgi:ubiquinone/menaquinone biosynthesis C-methylase UbiE